MASLLSSSTFSSGGSGALGGLKPHHYSPLKIPKHTHHDHSIFHNLLTDIRDAAVGIPMGLIDTGKAIGSAATGDFHPFGKLASNIGHSMAWEYGPLVHGHYGEFLHRVGQHPLQPILDAISIATLPFAGAGAGLKAADALSMGRVASLTKAASRFRPGVEGVTQHTLTDVGGAPSRLIHYSTNPTTRTLQKGVRGAANWLGNYEGKAVGPLRTSLESKFGSSLDLTHPNPFDITNRGVHERKLRHLRSERSVAAGALWHRELAAVNDVMKHTAQVDPKELANMLAPAIIQGSRMHALWVPASNLLTGGKALHEGWDFLDRKGRYHQYPKDFSPEEFHRWVTNFGEHLVTGGKRKRALTKYIGGEKHYAVVRRNALQDYLEEGAHTQSALHALYRTPTKIWKWAILATAPRYFVNNVIGNALMVAASTNPVALSRGIYDTIRDTHSAHAAERSLSSVDKAVSRIAGRNWIEKYYSAAMHGFSQDVTKDMRLNEKLKSPVLAKIAKYGQQGLYGVTHNASDIVPRKMMVNTFIKQHPEYREWRQVLKQEGYNGRRLHTTAAEQASENPAVRAWVTHKVDDVLGQYHRYGKSGRVMKSIVPFYGWDRAIMRHTGVMVRDRPVEAAVLAQLGQQGTAETKKALGQIPDFLKGAIPIGGKYAGGILGVILGVGHNDRRKILTTQGLNPYATVPDVTDALGSLVHGDPKVGEEIGNQINPLITGAVQHLTGQSLVSGKKIKRHGGLLPDIATQTAQSLPFVRVAQTAIGGRPMPKRDSHGKIKTPLLYRGDTRQQVLGLLGVPIKEESPKAAQELYRRERGITKARAKKYKPFTYKKSNSALFSTVRSSGRKYRRRRPRKPHSPRLSAPSFHPSSSHSILSKIKF